MITIQYVDLHDRLQSISDHLSVLQCAMQSPHASEIHVPIESVLQTVSCALTDILREMEAELEKKVTRVA